MNVLFREEFATLRPGSVHDVLVGQDHPSSRLPFSGQPNVGRIRKVVDITCGLDENEWMMYFCNWRWISKLMENVVSENPTLALCDSLAMTSTCIR